MKSSLELQQLFIIDEDGYLAWKDSFPAHSFEDPLRVLLRGYPFEPPAVPTVDSFNPPNEMTRVGDRVYSIPNEDTGYKGLLRLSQLFPEFLNKPFEQILMIGSISYYGLHELIEWLKLHNSETAEITIVDSSESIVNLLFFLYQQDFFLTNNKINFVMQDIVEYSPDKQFDLVITDNLLQYTFDEQVVVTHVPEITDYGKYSAIISHVRGLLSNNGCFLSRTFHDEIVTPIEVLPPIKHVTLEDIQEARKKIAKLLGADFATQILDDHYINALSYPWYTPTTGHGCGIRHILDSHYHLWDKESVSLIDQIMESVFPGSTDSRIDVISSQPNWTFHSYCAIKRET